MSPVPVFSFVHPRSGRRLTLALHAGTETLSATLVRQQTYEPKVSALIIDLLRPGDVVIDVGANIGWHTVLAAECVGAGGTVYAFEPDPANFAALDANCEANGLTQVVRRRCAAGDRACEGLLWTSTENFGDHRMYAVPGETRPCVSAKIAALDDDPGTRLTGLRLVKIDVQGYEPKVLRGMTGLAERFRPALAMEFWPHGIAAAGDSVFDVLGFIERFDYEPYLLTAAGLELSTVGVLLELSRTLLHPDTRKFIDLALLQPGDRQLLLEAPAGVQRDGSTGGAR